MQTKYPTKPYVRKVLQLTGSAPHSLLRLSHQAIGAARLTVLMLARASSPKATLSAVTRRALLDYAARIEAMTPEERASEARRVADASRALPPDRDDLEAIREALEAAEASADAPLPTLAQVTFAPRGPTPEDLELRVNHILRTAMPRKFAHFPTA